MRIRIFVESSWNDWFSLPSVGTVTWCIFLLSRWPGKLPLVFLPVVHALNNILNLIIKNQKILALSNEGNASDIDKSFKELGTKTCGKVEQCNLFRTAVLLTGSSQDLSRFQLIPGNNLGYSGSTSRWWVTNNISVLSSNFSLTNVNH